MHRNLLFSDLLWYRYILMGPLVYLPIFFRVIAMSLWLECPGPHKVILKVNGNGNSQTTTKHNKAWAVCIIIGVQCRCSGQIVHCSDVIMSTMGSQITSLTIVYSTVYSDADQGNIKAPRHWPVRGIHRWPVNSTHKGLVTRKMSPFDDVIMRVTENFEQL